MNTNDSSSAVLKMYAEDDLGANPVFQGSYINFGYWKEIDLAKPLTLEDRINASKALYQNVFDQFLSDDGDLVVAEIGCGRGMGCGLLSEHPSVRSITGIDLNPQQVARADKIRQSSTNPNAEKIRFRQGAGEATGLTDNTFDVVYSVEASQHFPSFEHFLNEVNRILKPGGVLVHTTFFATRPDSVKTFETMFLTAASGVDHFRPLEEVKAACDSHGFTLVTEQSIGEQVFYGFDQWTSQLDESEQEIWVNNLLKGYQERLIDYNVLVSRSG